MLLPMMSPHSEYGDRFRPVFLVDATNATPSPRKAWIGQTSVLTRCNMEGDGFLNARRPPVWAGGLRHSCGAPHGGIFAPELRSVKICAQKKYDQPDSQWPASRCHPFLAASCLTLRRSVRQQGLICQSRHERCCQSSSANKPPNPHTTSGANQPRGHNKPTPRATTA